MHLGSFLKELPDDAVCAVGGIGVHQTRAIALGLASGGGVRVGLEDNLWLDRDRSVKATNPALVERTMQLASALEREPLTPAELRQRLKLRA